MSTPDMMTTCSPIQQPRPIDTAAIFSRLNPDSGRRTQPTGVGEDPNRAIFVDKVHLTDHGNERIAERLNAMIHR